MKKMKLTSILIQGGLLIAFAGGFYYVTQTQVKPTNVYTFSRDISANTVLTEGDLVKKAVPKDAVTKNMVTNKSDIVGKAISTKAFPGEYVVNQMLIAPKDIDAFSKMDLSTYRKISIPVDMKEAVGGNLKKGDKVDLTYTSKIDTNDKDYTYAKTFMQDVIVYNVVDENGRKYVDQTEGNTNLTNEQGEVSETAPLKVVTLAVTPQQAEEIQARLQNGKVKILGRFDASTNTSTPGYTIGDHGQIPATPVNPEVK